MSSIRRANHSVLWYMEELASRVVADSGIPTDRFHFGKIILQNFKNAPDFVTLIDGGTGNSETCKSMLEKSVRCAISLGNMGLKQGDVMVLTAPTHTKLAVPFYAALYLGIIIAPVDATFGANELQNSFKILKPKIIFCEAEKVSAIKEALISNNLKCKLVTFNESHSKEIDSFADFLTKYGDETSVENFKPNDFNAENAIAFTVPTSGSTGLPKTAALTHKNFYIQGPCLWARFTRFPTPTRIALISPIQWLTACFSLLLSPVLQYTLLQTSTSVTKEHIIYLINTYKPTYAIFGPTIMTTILKFANIDGCDFSNFEMVKLGGSAVSQDLVDDVKKLMPKADILNLYGMTEMCGLCFQPDNPLPGSSGKPMGTLQYRLINTETQEDINEPNVKGELWVKGPGVIKEYYNDPVATKEAFSEDGWFKTGDILYRDEQWNFYFVERIKLLLKYKSHQISPLELENVIRSHPGVGDVAVTGVPDPECGDLPIAFVVPRTGCHVTAQEIKCLVKESLTDSKQLRGGVIFLEQLPLNSSMKVHRPKLKEMALNMKSE